MLREVSPPAGYLPVDHVFDICVDACGCIFVDDVFTPKLNIINTPISASFTAVKVNIESGDPLADAVYTLFMNSTAVATAVSNAAGQVTFTGLAPGTYELTETTPPPGFQANTESLMVVVAPDGNVTINGQPANGFLLHDVPLSEFIFRKLDASTGLPLAGATFALTQNGTIIGIATSGSDGLVNFGILAAGTYQLTETIPPVGFQPNSIVYQVVVKTDGSIMVNDVPLDEFVVEDVPVISASFTAVKVNIESGEPLAGAEYTLFMDSTAVATAVSNAAGQVTFTGLAPGTYELTETTPPPGFQMNTESLTVVAAPDGSVTINGQPANGFLLHDVPLSEFIFRKLDASTGLPLAGATFTLTQNGTIVGIATSGSDGLVNFGILTAGTYQLMETIPPVGYQPNSTVYQVIVETNGSIMVNGIPLDEFVVEDIPIAVSASPTIDTIIEGAEEITGTGVVGATVTVTLPNGSMVSTTVDSNGTWLVNVPNGIVLAVGEIVTANQTEPGKTISGDVHSIVIGNTDIEPGISIFVENLTTGLNFARAGDLLLYDAVISNDGTASSVWQSAYAIFDLGSSVTLQVSSIRINNRVVTPSQFIYDSAANTLTLFLGDIVGGSSVSVSYRVTVNSDISNINEIILDVTLGSLV